jgi:RNA polymerase sigma factor (sigma-70 family)
MARRRVALDLAELAAHTEAIRVKLRKAGVPQVWLEDLTQSVLLTWLQKGPRGPVSRERRWLLEVARKMAANWRNRHARFYEVLGAEDLLEPADERIDLERQTMVREALATVPPWERAVVEALAEGCVLSELAERFGVTKSGVHVWVRAIRERAALRELRPARARPRKREQKKP